MSDEPTKVKSVSKTREIRKRLRTDLLGSPHSASKTFIAILLTTVSILLILLIIWPTCLSIITSIISFSIGIALITLSFRYRTDISPIASADKIKLLGIELNKPTGRLLFLVLGIASIAMTRFPAAETLQKNSHIRTNRQDTHADNTQGIFDTEIGTTSKRPNSPQNL